MMGGMDMWVMALVVGLGGLLLVALVATGTVVAVRTLRERREGEPLGLLQRRLAVGEIGSEEFFERESALRHARPARRPRRRLL
jgi:uncharacterized membrane protein